MTQVRRSHITKSSGQVQSMSTVELNNHRIMEQPRLQGTSRDHLVQHSMGKEA